MGLTWPINKVASTFQLPPSTKVTRYKLCGTMSLITDMPLITITLCLSSSTFHDHWRHFSIITSTTGEELGYSNTSSYTWSKKFVLSRYNYISSHQVLVCHHDTSNLLVLGNASQCFIVCSISKVCSCFCAWAICHDNMRNCRCSFKQYMGLSGPLHGPATWHRGLDPIEQDAGWASHLLGTSQKRISLLLVTNNSLVIHKGIPAPVVA
jgi:hypothetical protein